MKQLVIIGAGGFGREVAWLVEDINKVNPEWQISGFVDDDDTILGTKINGYEVLGNLEWLKKQDIYAVCALGDPKTKKKIIVSLENTKVKFPVLIHPSVIKSDLVDIGDGCIICAANVFTVNITIGKHVIVNLDCTIGHDAVIGDYSTILPSVNISGCVTFEQCVNMGTGTQIIQGVKIGANTTVGAGSVVVKELPPNCTAVGCPAKPIKFHDI